MTVTTTYTLEALTQQISSRGAVVTPTDLPAYDDLRATYSYAYAGRPNLIIVCGGTADVVQAVKYCISNKLKFTVKCGGHSSYASVDDVVQINLSGMRAIHVDPVTETTRFQGGCRNWDVDLECSVYGLHTTLGNNADTGVGGYVCNYCLSSVILAANSAN